MLMDGILLGVRGCGWRFVEDSLIWECACFCLGGGAFYELWLLCFVEEHVNFGGCSFVLECACLLMEGVVV